MERIDEPQEARRILCTGITIRYHFEKEGVAPRLIDGAKKAP